MTLSDPPSSELLDGGPSITIPTGDGDASNYASAANLPANIESRWRNQKLRLAAHYPGAREVLRLHAQPTSRQPLPEVDRAFDIYGGYWGWDMLLWAWDIASWLSAEDIVIEALARVLEHAARPGRLDVTIKDGTPYLYKTIRNTLAERHRYQGRPTRHETTLTDHLQPEDPSEADRFLDYESQQEVETLITQSRLSDQEANVIRYIYIHDLSTADIQAIMRLRERDRVYSLKNRALTKMKRVHENREAGQP